MKQVIVVNSALKLPKGKLAAQVAHAAVAGFLMAPDSSRKVWLEQGMPKTVLAGKDDAHILEIFQQAKEANLPAHLIQDAGRTVIPAGTITCVGIGPAPEEEIDRITGLLKLV